MLAANGNRHRIPRRCTRDTTADRLIGGHFGVIHPVVAGKGIDDHLWQHGINQQCGLC
ncbi:Uncharacterised protein [Enterobacter ludwigii]|nr:Uncharacterised protein [Enterobacter ludwigii]